MTLSIPVEADGQAFNAECDLDTSVADGVLRITRVAVPRGHVTTDILRQVVAFIERTTPLRSQR